MNGNENERDWWMLLNQWECLAVACQGAKMVVEKRRGLCWVFFERPGAKDLNRLCKDGMQGRLRVRCHRYCQVSALATKPRSQGRHAVPCPGGRRGPDGGESSRMPRADWHGAVQ